MLVSSNTALACLSIFEMLSFSYRDSTKSWLLDELIGCNIVLHPN